MLLLTVFGIFIACMVLSLILDISMLVPLAIGFVLFSLLARKCGFTWRQILLFAKDSCKDSFIVIGILLIIGCLTGMWRQSGTVAYFVTLGVSLIPPQLFILAAFLLSAAMSFAIGTSFGVTATAGVILMSIARAGGADPVWSAAAILSGVYVGDRGSPAASSANLVSVLTHTDMRRNVREMLRSSILPFFLCCAIYAAKSLLAPMHDMDTAVLRLLEGEFRLQWYCLIPAVLMIVLPFCNLSVKLSMAVSLLSSVCVGIFLQGSSPADCLRAMVVGFTPKDEVLTEMLSGGGLVSMLEVCGILLISGTYGGLFSKTGILDGVRETLRSFAARIGRYPVMVILGTALSAVFCNQTIAVIMQNQLSGSLYGDQEEERYAKMLDMENSVILLAGIVPWCIASSVPLGMLGAGAGSIPFAFYLWLIPLFRLIRSAADRKHQGGRI